MSKADGLDGMKQWKCKNGHVLGVIQRVKTGNGHVTRLMLFRDAIDLKANGQAKEIDVIANIEGTTLDVRCSVARCGEVRSWFMGEDAMERLVEQMRNAGHVVMSE
jgi:hypothetical protein